MTSRVRAPIADLEAGERDLDPAASHYLGRVLRLGAGARFVAFDPAGATEADAEIVSVVGERARVRISAPRPAAIVATRAIAWVHALSKGDKLDDIVRDATELGATQLVVAEAARSVVHLDAARAAARRERWTKIAQEAARQSGRGDPPVISGPLPWAEALAAVPPDAARFCLHPGDAPTLGPRLLAALARGSALGFATGPEGGLTDDEVARADAIGFARASLGPFVLRTETVPAAVLGACRILGSMPTG
jgi:16S rRNA (uracil1498-N3)-methyltransferase